MQLIGLFPFKLIVFKYLLNIHSEEVQCQLEEDTGALCCPKQFSFSLRRQRLFSHQPLVLPRGSLTPTKHSYQIVLLLHGILSLRGPWWIEFLPSWRISNIASPHLHPTLLCEVETWLRASGLCKRCLWELIGGCLIKKIMFITSGKFCPHFTYGASCYLWRCVPLVKEKQRWELACPGLPA